MGTKTFDGVRFAAWSDEHLPAHVHGFYAGVEVILDLDFETRKIRLADRWDRIMPLNAKISDVRKVRRAADRYGDELFKLWERARG